MAVKRVAAVAIAESFLKNSVFLAGLCQGVLQEQHWTDLNDFLSSVQAACVTLCAALERAAMWS
jgi:hypothetical protein